jgi:hypothetical protein
MVDDGPALRLRPAEVEAIGASVFMIFDDFFSGITRVMEPAPLVD